MKGCNQRCSLLLGLHQRGHNMCKTFLGGEGLLEVLLPRLALLSFTFLITLFLLLLNGGFPSISSLPLNQLILLLCGEFFELLPSMPTEIYSGCTTPSKSDRGDFRWIIGTILNRGTTVRVDLNYVTCSTFKISPQTL